MLTVNLVPQSCDVVIIFQIHVSVSHYDFSKNGYIFQTQAVEKMTIYVRSHSSELAHSDELRSTSYELALKKLRNRPATESLDSYINCIPGLSGH